MKEKSHLLIAALLLSSPALQANEATIRIEGDEKKTIGEFVGTGTVCVEIVRDDGSNGRLKMWTLGINESSKRMETGSACFNIFGYTKIRAGFTDGGTVTIKVTKVEVTPIPIPIDSLSRRPV